ncbi:MAG: dihydrolipoamide acetyltransferase family protein [Microbacter sp.]
MRYIFNFPDIGEGLDEGTILEWYVQKGQPVKAGQALVRMETDKVVTDIPSPKTGVIVEVYGSVGETIHVGHALVEIEMEGIVGAAAVAEANNPVQILVEEEGAAVVGTLEVAGNNALLASSHEGFPSADISVTKTSKVLATPVARAVARTLQIDIQLVPGTGPAGRVTKDDVQRFALSKNQAPAMASAAISSALLNPMTDRVTYEPLTQIRKTIAKNMLQSMSNSAQMTVFDEVEVSELSLLREHFKKERPESTVKLTYLPFVIKAVVNALKQFPIINAQMDLENDRFIMKHYYHVAIAVDTNEGLVVPVIRDADVLSVLNLAAAVASLAEKAKNRSLTLDDMKDGTFTVTNYGSIGGLFATPVLNYPQVGILGVGRLIQKPIVKNNAVVIGTVLPLSLTVDHRVVDGSTASRFLNAIMNDLSNPTMMLLT